MSASRPPDSRPLFPIGFHRLSVSDVEKACVDPFPRSTTRKAIMENLKAFVTYIQSLGAIGELWLDGSFVTAKIDPEDVDIVLRYDATAYDDPKNIRLRAAIDWVGNNQKKALLCDSYTLAEYPEDHHLYEEGKWWYSYWHAKWGFSREEDPKGIVVIPLVGSVS